MSPLAGAALTLGGVALAGLLTWSLVRSLSRGRARGDAPSKPNEPGAPK